MSLTLKRSPIGLVLLAALAAGCSSPSSPAPKPTVHHTSVPSTQSNQIPQNNGGDHDGDNNGGPSDGDGNL